jgi:hypothetical protein
MRLPVLSNMVAKVIEQVQCRRLAIIAKKVTGSGAVAYSEAAMPGIEAGI